MKKIFVVFAIIFTTHFLAAQSNPSIDKRAEYLTDWLNDVLDLESQQKSKIYTVYQTYLSNMVNMLDIYRDNIAELRNQKDVLEVKQQQSIGAILNDVQLEKYRGIILKHTDKDN